MKPNMTDFCSGWSPLIKFDGSTCGNAYFLISVKWVPHNRQQGTDSLVSISYRNMMQVHCRIPMREIRCA